MGRGVWREEWHRGRGGARLVGGGAGGGGGDDFDGPEQMTRCGREKSKGKRKGKVRSEDEHIILMMERKRMYVWTDDVSKLGYSRVRYIPSSKVFLDFIHTRFS